MTDVVQDVESAGWVEAAASAGAEGFSFFDVLTAVDLEQDGFDVVLRLWDPVGSRGLLLRTRCSREDPRVPTLTGLLPGAAWHERATAEMFGITFDGHATTRLLLAPGFSGHPLRKDFVLASRVAKSWPGAKDPGESSEDLSTGGRSRRRLQPPGVPPGWGST